ncbi:MAG: phosphomannose isomerase type II C-terminal cupin domain [Elusimicrobiota bacterium]|nr:phosphomannose isomerase type II C-terminal cupin domain [Elusimicrobiota bacterium]
MEHEKRPWGEYTVLKEGEGFKVKSIIVNPRQKLSLQLHHKRAEHWVIVRGKALITLDDKEFELQKNEGVYIETEVKHRIENKETGALEFIEVQTGDYLGEDDIERFDDIYGRIK